MDSGDYVKGLQSLLDEAKKKRDERHLMIEHRELMPKDMTMETLLHEIWYFDGKLDGLNLALVLLIEKVGEELDITEPSPCPKCGLPIDLCVCETRERNLLGR
ncbi:hypothetical protein MUP01_12105 [Candidatus Bathyarchaeota archaeon]|nr:hypothetical protein [Candidatus Bathyarchaeota archaeon]